MLACGSEDGCAGRRQLVGDQHVGDRRLARAEPPDRGDGQPRRHAVDLRDADEHGRAGRRARPPARPPRASATTQLASISRAVTMNDPQLGDGTAEGAAKDQNVELLVDDPRRATIRGTAGNDVIRGTLGTRRDPLRGGRRRRQRPAPATTSSAADRATTSSGSGRGRDRVSGGSGRDRLFGGPGRDRLFGRRRGPHLGRADDLLARGGAAERTARRRSAGRLDARRHGRDRRRRPSAATTC